MSKPTKVATKFLVAGCFHVPYHDPEACERFKQTIISEQPDVVVINGDLLEAGAASVHPNEDPHTLQEEYAQASYLLAEIRRAATYRDKPAAKLVYMLGNHDANILAENRIPKKLRGLCDFKTHMAELENWKMPCEYVYDRKRGVFSIGQVDIFHGYECGVAALKNQALTLSRPFCLSISSHTHRPVAVHQVMLTQNIPLLYWAANTGCMRDLKPAYVERKQTHNWGHAYVIGDCDASLKSPRESVNWSAETRFIKMSDDYMRPKFEGQYGRFAAA